MGTLNVIPAVDATFVPGVFTPLALSPAAWWDFGDTATLWQDTSRTSPITADGQLIKGVTDKSSNGAHLSEATHPPTHKTSILNSRSIGRFNGSDTLLTAAVLSPGTTISIFYVYTGASASAGSSRGVVGNTGAGGKLITRNNNIWPNDSFASMTPSPSLGTQSVIGLVYDYDGDTYAAYENGALSISDSVARTPLATTVTIGRDNNTVTYFSGDVGEVVIVNRAVTGTERSNVTSYLGGRWGITVV